MMDITILYEDTETLVVSKPVGMVVNRSRSTKEPTVQDWIESSAWWPVVRAKCDDKLFLDRSGICHRLDKETSGCLVIAKSPEALGYYLDLFKTRQIAKTYVALVHGRVEPDEGEVILPLKRSLFDRERWQVHYEGKQAITAWRVSKRFLYPGHEHWKDALSYLQLNLKTGRTHQIRVHLSFLGWPVFSDYKYLNRKFAREDRKYLAHHFLHAEQIGFTTFGGEKILVQAPLPVDCQKFLSSLSEMVTLRQGSGQAGPQD